MDNSNFGCLKISDGDSLTDDRKGIGSKIIVPLVAHYFKSIR